MAAAIQGMVLRGAGAIFLAIGLAGGLAVGLGHTAVAQTRLLEYKVLHPVLGDIGTYTNLIQRNGDAVTVTSQLHVVAKMLDVVMHREDARRVEHWLDGRLVSFDGVTTVNGDTTKLHGQADGNQFVINTPHGRVLAPADICPSNPWSAHFLRHTVMLGTDDGTIEHVHVVDGGEVAVEVRGKPERARLYDIYGKWRDQVWLDANGVPVRFSDEGRGSRIVFALTGLVVK